MVAVLPVVFGAIAALYVTLFNPAGPSYLQDLSAIALRGALPTVTALRRYFNHQVTAALPTLFSVLDELSPHSVPLALFVTKVVMSSQATVPYIDRVWDTLASVEVEARVWLEPHAKDFGLDPWFEWRLMYEADGSIFCGKDGLEFRLICYYLLRPVPHVARSVDLYQPGTKAVAVFGRTPPVPACLPFEPSYHYRLNVRSVNVYGRGKRFVTVMNRVLLVQPYLPLPYPGSNSLDIYRCDTKALALYNRTPSLQVHLLEGLLARFYSSVADLIFRQVRFVLVCALAAVCVLAIGVLVGHSLAVTDIALEPVRVPFQQFYTLVLDDAGNSQDKEPECWSLIPLPLLDTRYNGYERDQGPDDSGICASDSHGVSTVADETAAVTVTSDLTTTLPVDPASVPLPRSEHDNIELAEDEARSTTDVWLGGDATAMSQTVDPASVPLPADDGRWGLESTAKLEHVSHSGGHDVSLLSADMVTDSDASPSNKEISTTSSGVLDGASIGDRVGPVGMEESSDYGPQTSFGGRVGGLCALPMGSLLTKAGQSAEISNTSGPLIGSGGITSTFSDMSLNSDILDGLSDAMQERPADDISWVDTRDDEVMDYGLAVLFDEPVIHSEQNHDGLGTNDLGAPTTQARTTDAQHDNVADVTVSMSVSVSAGSTGTSIGVVAPGLDAQLTGTTGASELTTEDSLDLGLGVSMGTRLLDIDLNALGGSIDGLVSDVDRTEGDMTGFKSNAPPTGTADASELSTEDLLDLDVCTRSRLLDIDLNDLGATELPSESSLDMNLDANMGSQLLDVDLNSLEDSTDDLMAGTDRSGDDYRTKPMFDAPARAALSATSRSNKTSSRLSARPKLPTIAEESFSSFADLFPDTTAFGLGAPRTTTAATNLSSKDSLDLNLDLSMRSRLLDIDLNDLEDLEDSIGGLVPGVGPNGDNHGLKPMSDTPAHTAPPATSALSRLLAGSNLRTIAEESFSSFANLSSDTTASELNASRTTTATANLSSRDSLDLNLDLSMRSRLLDIDLNSLNDLEDSIGGLAPIGRNKAHTVLLATSGSDKALSRLLAGPNLPTIAEESFSSFANLSPDTTAFELDVHHEKPAVGCRPRYFGRLDWRSGHGCGRTVTLTVEPGSRARPALVEVAIKASCVPNVDGDEDDCPEIMFDRLLNTAPPTAPGSNTKSLPLTLDNLRSADTTKEPTTTSVDAVRTDDNPTTYIDRTEIPADDSDLELPKPMFDSLPSTTAAVASGPAPGVPNLLTRGPSVSSPSTITEEEPVLSADGRMPPSGPADAVCTSPTGALEPNEPDTALGDLLPPLKEPEPAVAEASDPAGPPEADASTDASLNKDNDKTVDTSMDTDLDAAGQEENTTRADNGRSTIPAARAKQGLPDSFWLCPSSLSRLKSPVVPQRSRARR
ncbi:hypothetical protein FRC10_005535 [Ceratobasidium sp. 414]|nr:hypothetical protein FRC10_005535 [Ceratobasidium sp. 414]